MEEFNGYFIARRIVEKGDQSYRLKLELPREEHRMQPAAIVTNLSILTLTVGLLVQPAGFTHEKP